jgi:hypothetical protein
VNHSFKSIICTLCLPLGFAAGNVFAQSLQDIAGAWQLVSAKSIHAGEKTDMYGAHPRGIFTIETNGRYVLVVRRANLPKIASNNRTTATAEENNAIVDGSMAHYGTLGVDAASHTLDFHIETSIYPNWDGVEQKRAFTLDGNELHYANKMGSTGSATELVWKRIK